MRAKDFAKSPVHSGGAAPPTRNSNCAPFGLPSSVVISTGWSRGIAVALLRMRKKLIVISPQQRIDRARTIGGFRTDERTPAPLARLLDKPRQHVVEPAPFEVIEKNFAHLPRGRVSPADKERPRNEMSRTFGRLDSYSDRQNSPESSQIKWPSRPANAVHRQ